METTITVATGKHSYKKGTEQHLCSSPNSGNRLEKQASCLRAVVFQKQFQSRTASLLRNILATFLASFKCRTDFSLAANGSLILTGTYKITVQMLRLIYLHRMQRCNSIWTTMLCHVCVIYSQQTYMNEFGLMSELDCNQSRNWKFHTSHYFAEIHKLLTHFG